MSKPTIAFDIGGTWVRSALILKNGTLVDYKKEPSVNFKHHPDWNIDALQQGLLSYILKRTQDICDHYSSFKFE